MNKTHTSLSLVIPVYNESALLDEGIVRCISSLETNFSDHELIMIDDGCCTEDSLKIEKYATQNPNVKMIRNDFNRNIGISIQRGFENAGKDIIVYNAIDLPLNPDDIPALVKELGESDLLVLQRKEYSGATGWRKFTSRINYYMIKTLFPLAGKDIKDFNYTFIFKRSVWPLIRPISDSPAFTQPEIILRAKYLRLHVKTIDVDYHPRKKGKGSLGKPRDILWSICDMLRFRLMSHSLKL